MNYLVAVLPDRIEAEAAYLALEKESIKATILGKGYKTADELGFICDSYVLIPDLIYFTNNFNYCNNSWDMKSLLIPFNLSEHIHFFFHK
ncbi:MAG: hypothetical protein HC773_22950 [Scytonema sp. CRU_2_7]|nr:hypothetical protein [Scytonema sp. CRU_2_7]